MKKIAQSYDIVVCGGGLAGYCAAVASARMGKKTCIIHNRPVFGGNSSSEIGVTPHGAAAFHAYARETGIISEILIEERAKNHAEIYENGWTNSVWDMVLYDIAVKETNLSIYLNTDVVKVIMDGKSKISAVVANIQNAETELTAAAEIFIDCTGDGIVADLAGCTWRMGSEGKAEFNEPHAPEQASADTMGNSIHFRTKNMGYPVPYTAPDWATKYDNADYFYKQGRPPKEERGGYWWLEIGVPFHTIYDNETIRHELTKHTLGVWHWMKNQDPIMKERCQNYALDWIGQVPGKRESRRIMGEYFMTEHDILNKTVFEDEIAFGGWFVDLHTPGGLLAGSSEPSSHNDNYDTFNEYSVMSYCGPYGVPLRACIAQDVDNLMMAGRNISTTHAALGTLRVMGTTALMGEACGVAAAYALEKNIGVKQIPTEAINDVKQKLLRNGCFLPNNSNQDATDLALTAHINASSEAKLYGAGPESTGFHKGLKVWRDQPQYSIKAIETRKGQFIAVADKVESVSVCLTNKSGEPQSIEAVIMNVDNIWDYRRETSAPLATTTLLVPEGENVWVKWNVNLTQADGLTPNGYIRIDLNANKAVDWEVAGYVVPGCLGVYQIGAEKMRRFSNGSTLAFQVTPAQPAFAAKNVISGVTRPYKTTNLWKSDPNLPLEQWLELSWGNEQNISTVELTFPGHLLREYHAYSPFYADAQCPKDFRIEVLKNNEWESVLAVKGNYHRQVKYQFECPISTSKLRIVVEKTNGDSSAMIYEVRCYK